MRGDLYQLFLVGLLCAVALLFGIFLSREIFPEYKIYQNAYVALEKFRSSLLDQPPPPFEEGVKQIVISSPKGGPETIDRCTSCHVALQIEAFSPTKIATDINGALMRDATGAPLKIPNENYIFRQLDEQIHNLTEAKRFAEADRLKKLRTVEVKGQTIDLAKVLMMHPLMGEEVRPFEFHSPDEIGCTICHNGNGRALTADKAHGPVFDHTYEEAKEGEHPKFLESDPANDPPFSRVFNHKPGHELLFQTTPLYVGGLIEANCVQCHRSSVARSEKAWDTLSQLQEQGSSQRTRNAQNTKETRNALISLMQLQHKLRTENLEQVRQDLLKQTQDYTRPEEERVSLAAQLQFLKTARNPEQQLSQDIQALIGSETLIQELSQTLSTAENPDTAVAAFVEKHQKDSTATGRLFDIARAANHPLPGFILPDKLASSPSSLDQMLQTYIQGEQLFVSQACYACHRIAGFARGGVGPELSQEGLGYPWYIKQKLVWPQGDFKASTMPNMRLDHGELEELVTYLLAQKGGGPATSPIGHQIDIKQWEAGKKLPIEEPLPPDQIYDLDRGMTIFATEGCAACHRLKGFVSNTGFTIEKEGNPSFEALQNERAWFRRAIPELIGAQDIPGSLIAQRLLEQRAEFEARIAPDVRTHSLLEKIEKEHPGVLESFYSNFAFALRSRDAEFKKAADEEKSPAKKQEVLQKLAEWKELVRRVLKVYIQEYGLGRLIGPRPNWSGIYRSDEWLMEHFREPGALVARSLMPVFPFDRTKFTALTYMLDRVGKRNLEQVHALWKQEGFNPQEAYNLHCAQCHGQSERLDEAPIKPWIYPIPKNLRNANFLRNLTRPRIIESITHGVKGTPMPPWGETPQDKPFANETPVLGPEEVRLLVDWLFRSLPGEAGGAPGSRDILKWDYTPEDVIEELRREGDELKGENPPEKRLTASLYPTSPSAQKKSEEIFEMRTNPVAGGVDKKAYYIRPQYYTDDNLAAGKHLFLENCAVCHGAEGGGDGTRAGEMSESKPRMFTNANWQETRDDIRLLRSIKFGVPGTSMVAWGDATSSLQRLQLVMYVRELGKAVSEKNSLENALYETFDREANAVRKARAAHYAIADLARASYLEAKATRQKLDQQPESTTQAVSAYQRELEALGKLKQQEAVDQLYERLLEEILAERSLYEREGKALLNLELSPSLTEAYFALVRANQERYVEEEGRLHLQQEGIKEKVEAAATEMQKLLDQQIADLAWEEERVKGKFATSTQRAELRTLQERGKTFHKIKNEITATVSAAARMRETQRLTYEQLSQAQHG